MADEERGRTASRDGDLPHDEQRPLLYTHFARHRSLSGDDSPQPAKLIHRVLGHMRGNVQTTGTDLILIACFFLAGLIDSGAYNAYECFTSMMTGNTIFAALGVSDLPVQVPKYAWVKSVCSIIAFVIGTLVFAHFHRRLGQRKRWTLALSFLVQTGMIVISALLVSHRKSSESHAKPPTMTAITLPENPDFPWMDLVPISLLSFQASGKVLTSRLVEYKMLPTLVLTTLYSDLLADPALFTAGIRQNPTRNRRFGGFAFYFIGAVIGGVMAGSHLGFSGALWLAVATNSLMTLAWVLWPADEETSSDED